MAPTWPSQQSLVLKLSEWIGSPPVAKSPFVIEWQGTTYRFASRKYADLNHFTDGVGARRSGGRFNPKNGPRTVYLSLERATALAELESWYAYYNLPDTAFQPRVLAAVAVSTGLLLDLSEPETVQALGLTSQHLSEDWRMQNDEGQTSSVQTFGRTVCEAGFEGILFSSARRASGFNLALFPENFRESSHAIMLNSDTD